MGRVEGIRTPRRAAQSTEAVVSVRGLTKDFGRRRAVDGLSFDVPSARVTGFLGPNGAGKTTTMRMLLGLATPTAGSSLVLGRPYRDLDRPARAVGVLLDPGTFHPKRTARNHLRWMAAAAGVERRRLDEVLSVVGLEAAAGREVGEFSTGMRQRLGLAAALLGEPELLVLDEPANGLDPAGIRWLREFLRSFAAKGGSVFVSSHILAEVAQVADEVVVINRGRLVTHTSVEELTTGAGGATRVRTPEAERFRPVLAEAGGYVADGGSKVLSVRGLATERVGELAAAHGVVLHELVGVSQSLEEVFFKLTAEEQGDA
jgi:ABC-2 type transport system ATP-binding protein